MMSFAKNNQIRNIFLVLPRAPRNFTSPVSMFTATIKESFAIICNYFNRGIFLWTVSANSLVNYCYLCNSLLNVLENRKISNEYTTKIYLTSINTCILSWSKSHYKLLHSFVVCYLNFDSAHNEKHLQSCHS